MTADEVPDDLGFEEPKLYRLLVHTVRDYGIFMLDPEGHVATWNEGAERIKGYSASEIVGRHFSAFYPPEDVAAGKPDMELVVAAREGRFEDEGWRVRKDGTRFWANVVITALRDEQGRLVSFAKVTRDLTERRAAQLRAIEDARRVTTAEVANRAKSDFLAAMSHELRTPLNAIGGFAELMAAGVGGPVSDQQQEYLTRIRRSQQHLLGIINDLLNFSRIEAGTVTYATDRVAVHDVVDAVTPLLELQAAAKQIVIEHGPCEPSLEAIGDLPKAEQILLNLLSNAVKFTPPGGRIVTSCRTVGKCAAIAVRDTGPGVPEEQAEAIFEPFVQLGRTFTSRHEGTGLGLAISRDLARGMGGDITLESEPDEGSTFTLLLPKSQ